MTREATIRQLQMFLEDRHKMVREIQQQQRVYIARDMLVLPQHVFIGKQQCVESPTTTHVFNLQVPVQDRACFYCKGQ